MSEDFKDPGFFVLVIFCSLLSVFIDFNLIGALVTKGYEWILDNWLTNIGSIVIGIIFFIGCHYMFIKYLILGKDSHDDEG